MALALRLAELGRGRVAPNPLVGAVVVQQGRVVGVGYHRRKGDPHAEVRALEEAGEHARNGTLFVTLEPHNFHGTTPPCTRAIREAGLRRVVVATLDPHPKVAGRGVEELRQAGISVEVGMGHPLARYQNRYFFTFHEKHRPYVILKLALTLDGRLTHPQRRWITSEEARRFVHRLRGEVDAVMVGAGTARADNPELTPRHVYAFRPPLRVLLGGREFPGDLKLFQTPPSTLWITEKPAIQPSGVEIWVMDPRDLRTVLSRLAEEKGIQSLLVEGGAEVAASFLKADLVDEVQWFVAPKVAGSGLTLEGIQTFFDSAWVQETLPLGEDILFRWVKREVFA